MQRQYTKDELWKLYNNLPQELKEAVFANETAEHIANTCARFLVPQELVPKVAAETGNVLLGLLTPEEFQKNLVKDIGLKKDVAQQVAREINRFVFYPVKPALEQLHKMEIEVSAKVTTPEPPTTETETPLPTEQEPEKKQGGPDSYRESIE